jgi:hypothetical protein
MKFFGNVAVGIHYFFWLIALNRCCIVVATSTDDDPQPTRLRGKGDEFSGVISDNLQLDEEVFWGRTLEGSFGESEGEGKGSESIPLSTSTLSSPDNNAKYPRVAAAKSAFYLRSCLLNVFQNATVNYVGDDTLPKVVFSPNTATSKDFNLTEYNTARGIQNYGTRYVIIIYNNTLCVAFFLCTNTILSSSSSSYSILFIHFIPFLFPKCSVSQVSALIVS